MTGANGKIIVKSNPDQKSFFSIGDVSLFSATKYDSNYREKSPVLAEVITGNGIVNSGDVIICHHNLFYLPSPHHLYDDFFSIKCNQTIFGKIDQHGDITPLYGNILCDRVKIEIDIPLPPEKKEMYIDKVVVTHPGNTMFKKGQMLFTRPYSFYEIVYVHNGIERRVHKCDSKMVCAMCI